MYCQDAGIGAGKEGVRSWHNPSYREEGLFERSGRYYEGGG